MGNGKTARGRFLQCIRFRAEALKRIRIQSIRLLFLCQGDQTLCVDNYSDSFVWDINKNGLVAVFIYYSKDLSQFLPYLVHELLSHLRRHPHHCHYHHPHHYPRPRHHRHRLYLHPGHHRHRPNLMNDHL